jgi:hypothetical protein
VCACDCIKCYILDAYRRIRSQSYQCSAFKLTHAKLQNTLLHQVVIGRTAPDEHKVIKRVIVLLNIVSWQPISATAEYKGPETASCTLNDVALTVGQAVTITPGDKLALVRTDLPEAEQQTYNWTVRVQGEMQPGAEVICLSEGEDEVQIESVKSAKRQRLSGGSSSSTAISSEDDIEIVEVTGTAGGSSSSTCSSGSSSSSSSSSSGKMPAMLAASPVAAAAAGSDNANTLAALATEFTCSVCQVSH